MESISIFGDSITQGQQLPPAWRWPYRVRQALLGAAVNDVPDYTYGINGDDSHGMLARLTPTLIATKSSYVLLAIGTNDTKIYRQENGSNEQHTGIHRYEGNMRHAIRIARGLGAKVACVGSVGVDEARTQPCRDGVIHFSNERIQSFNRVLKEVCAEEGALYINTFDSIPAEDLADGIHPNATGHSLLATRIATSLQQTGWYS